MPRTLVKHGSNSGYRAELSAGGDPCIRCRNAHRVFQTQYSRENRAKGIKYTGAQVIDHLYGTSSSTKPTGLTSGFTPYVRPSTVDPPLPTDPDGTDPPAADLGPSRPSLSDRVRGLIIGEADNEYVEDTDYPDYLTPDSVDPDPDPAGSDYHQVPEDSAEYVINAAGMAKIEDSLGTYLSIFGITMEMVDPYCGPILAENMDNIVRRWAKVIAKYPKAAEMFMEGKGGTLMLWIGAIQATWPFLFAMYEHHFSKDVQTSGGNIYRKGTDRFAQTVDPTGGQDQFAYTAG
jgi:hypothetical protein